MTAKEMLEQATMITDNVNGTAYFFTEPKLKDFVTQLCKEQRELCANSLCSNLIDYHMPETFCAYARVHESREEVLNTPQPNIFEEGNA